MGKSLSLNPSYRGLAPYASASRPASATIDGDKDLGDDDLKYLEADAERASNASGGDVDDEFCEWIFGTFHQPPHFFIYHIYTFTILFILYNISIYLYSSSTL